MARKLVADNSFKQLDKFTKAGFQCAKFTSDLTTPMTLIA